MRFGPNQMRLNETAKGLQGSKRVEIFTKAVFPLHILVLCRTHTDMHAHIRTHCEQSETEMEGLPTWIVVCEWYK